MGATLKAETSSNWSPLMEIWKTCKQPKKPLMSGSEYEVLTMSLKQKKLGQVILVFMPPPKINNVVATSFPPAYVYSPIETDLGYRRWKLCCEALWSLWRGGFSWFTRFVSKGPDCLYFMFFFWFSVTNLCRCFRQIYSVIQVDI